MNIVNIASRKTGFMLLECLVTCFIVMLTWFYITNCAVQALTIEQQIESKIAAFIAASTTLEKLRAGVYPLKTQTITQADASGTDPSGNSVPVEIVCAHQASLVNDKRALYCPVEVKVMKESVCIKTIILY